MKLYMKKHIRRTEKIGSGFNTFYSICVDSVERFTLPMEIQYFSNKNGKMINRAPQSWCYCELR